jgi:hypothetical protein
MTSARPLRDSPVTTRQPGPGFRASLGRPSPLTRPAPPPTSAEGRASRKASSSIGRSGKGITMLCPRPVSAQVVLSGTVGAHPVDLNCCHPAASGTPCCARRGPRGIEVIGRGRRSVFAAIHLQPRALPAAGPPPIDCAQLVDGEDHGRTGAPPTHGQLAR